MIGGAQPGSQGDFFSRRPKRAPHPKEFAIHCVVADIVRRFISPGWEWTHLPFGEYRTPATAGRLKRMGVNGGWPDFVFVSPTGRHYYLELKRHGGESSDAQRRIRGHLIRGGVGYLCTSQVNDAILTLRDWGALRPDVRL